MSTVNAVQEQAMRRHDEAYEAKYKHVRAANEWQRVGGGAVPEEVAAVLSDWMSDYATADAKAMRAFEAIVNRDVKPGNGKDGAR